MEEATIRLEEAQKSFEEAEKELLEAKRRYRKAKEELEVAEKAVKACEEKITEETEVALELKIPVLSLSKQYMNNCKVSRMLRTRGIEVEEDTVKINALIQDDIKTRVYIWKDDDLPTISVSLTRFDAVVMDAVYTVLCAGYKVFTVDTIAKVIAGNGRLRLNDKNAGVLRESIEKLRHVHIQIDCADEMAERKDIAVQEKPRLLESRLLPVIPVEAEYQVNGKYAQAYRITETSVLYVYASLLHQIVDVPAEWMDTSRLFSDTAEAVLIKRYVIRRVAQIINPRNRIKSNKIAFYWDDHGCMKGLFPELGYKMTGDSRWRSIKKRVRRIVELTLQSLQGHKVITDYREYREDGTNNPASPVQGFMVFYDSPSRSRKGGSYYTSHAT